MLILNLGFLDEGTSDKEGAEKFGPLKATLGVVPAVYANNKVRSQYPA